MPHNFTIEQGPRSAAEGIGLGLQAAFADESIEVPAYTRKGFTPHNVKIQKLAYRVAEEWEIPIIRTWYKYGQFQPYNSFRPKNVQPKHLSEETLQREVESGRFGSVTVREIKGYFIESQNVSEVWNVPMFNFLHSNYKEWAPKDFRRLYLANLDILEVLETVVGTDPGKLSADAENLVSTFQGASLDLKFELKDREAFDPDVVSNVCEFLNSLQEVLIYMSGREPSKIPMSSLDRAYELYHNSVLSWAAMNISIKEAEVPEREKRDFKKTGEELVEEYEETTSTRVSEWQSEIDRLGLVPDASDFRAVHSTPGDALTGFQETIVRSDQGHESR